MSTADTALRMDRMYRLQRFIYDPTRKFYLLGRDRLLDSLPLRPGDRVLEVGCGTGRNLAKLARSRPDIGLFGIDASREMLKNAERRLRGSNARLVQGLAEEVDFRATFGLDRPFDVVIFSYSLSMIPTWRESIDRALLNVKPGGLVAAVDFWDQAGWPDWFQALLRRWLLLFGVEHRPAVLDYFHHLAAQGRGTTALHPVLRRYAYTLHFACT